MLNLNVIIASIVSVVLLFVAYKIYRWVEQGGIYYLQYPIAKELDVMTKNNESLSSTELDKVMAALNPLKKKKEMLEEFKSLVKKVKNGEDIVPFIKP